jgi:helicase
LDPARSAIVISMPTSAGKTLLAELAIVQAINDNPGMVAVYIAPTKALVTQASLTLRRDLVDRGLTVRVATPVFELDPVEAEVLSGRFDVLVTTPEKLDLLVKEEHPAVAAMALVVVDEAHNIGDPQRGARLELLLATLRRERPETRFLLMTPFASNAQELARWLGGDRGTPFVLDWKPNDRVVGTVEPREKVRGEDRRGLVFVSLDSAHSDCPGGEEIAIGYGRADMSAKKRIAVAASLKWADARRGGVLLLAASRPDAEERAGEVAAQIDEPARTPESVDVITRFLNTEAGGLHPLSALLGKGVAFHHAGLSTEARYFVERLVEEGAIKVLCATTTLAQGVHFPLSAAVIETFHRSVRRRGQWLTESLKPWEFWNIAGRVGRTLEDELGVVTFAARNAGDRAAAQEYVRDDASTVSSSLFELLEVIDGWGDVSFNRALIERVPAASAFLQYILHAMAVAGGGAARTDMEALIRGSLLFEQAQAERPELADSLVRLARAYADDLRARKGEALAGFAKMADGTGFSSPSIDLIFGEWRTAAAPPHPVEDWLPDAFIPEQGAHSELLREVIDTLHRVPEARLGSEDEGEFSAERFARITSMWVNGISLAELAAQEYGGDLLKCAHHVYGTITNLLPWGLRAVQRVALSGQPDDVWEEISLIPGMIFHGVRSREAIALRMLSVPRLAAEGLASQWRQAERVELSAAADWLYAAGHDVWQAALPPDAAITGAECKRLWEILEGRRSWRDLSG